MLDYLFYLVPVASIIALFFAWLFYHRMMKESEGTVTMKEIAQYVREGAIAYLKQQYKVVGIVFIVLSLFLSSSPTGSESKIPGFRSRFLREDFSPPWRGTSG